MAELVPQPKALVDARPVLREERPRVDARRERLREADDALLEEIPEQPCRVLEPGEHGVGVLHERDAHELDVHRLARLRLERRGEPVEPLGLLRPVVEARPKPPLQVTGDRVALGLQEG